MTHGSNAASALVAGVDAAMIDLDGTLVDTLGDFTEALGRMLADLGLPAIGAAQVETMVGKGSEHLLRSVRSEEHTSELQSQR